VRPRSLRSDLADLRERSRPLAEYLTEICDRIDECDPRIRAFVPEPDRRGRLLSTGAGVAAPTGAQWRGIPVAVKDIIHVDGFVTRAGSAVPPEALAGRQASAVTRLTDAGALVAGKTVTAEFAAFAPGPTANPHRLDHTPGGSSSGSAAAVATRMCPLALGTQTIASIVRPAAYCGVVGFKPTYGRVALDGVIPNSPSLDSLGWFTATVDDAALAAGLLVPDWHPAPRNGRLPILGIPTARYLGKATHAARDAFAAHVTALRDAGFEVRHTSVLEDFDELAEALRIINRTEFARTHARWFGEYGTRYRPQTAAVIQEGMRIPETEYTAALRRNHDFATAFTDATADAGVDVWIAPAATQTAPAGLDSTGDPVMGIPFSLAGAPALSIPAGLDGNGLPWGLQCAAPAGCDERLLAFAAAIEAVFAR
jgi:Asp-tRNA(Asn)/Glu-tRNA(Gln) amidotransferase A subunit family amidase